MNNTPGKIVVTGATGFIGSRLCELLALQYQLPYRACVRNYFRAFRIARLDPEMVTVDLLSPDSMDQAVAGCDTVIHLAHADDDRLGPAVTANVVRAAVQHKVRRFIHISSYAVHGLSPKPDCVTEDGPLVRRSGDTYCDSKAAEERIVWRAIHKNGLPAVILRPGIVYGPYSPFVLQVINSARRGVISLIDDGRGTCNAVFVDDVCGAIHAAIFNDHALGQAFFVNASHAVTWRDFIMTFGNLVTPSPRVEQFTTKEVEAAQHVSLVRENLQTLLGLVKSSDFHRQLGSVPVFRAIIGGVKRNLIKCLSEEKVLALKARNLSRPSPTAEARATPMPNLGRLSRETMTIEFSVARAAKTFDWSPAYDFTRGAAVTRSWLEFARLLK